MPAAWPRVLVMALLGLGLCAGRDALPTQADSAAYISNISVGVVNGTVSYYVCVVAPSPPSTGIVMVTGAAKKQYLAHLNYVDHSCGSGAYLMTGTLTHLPAQRYHFGTACVLLGQGAVLPCLNPAGGLVSNFKGQTVTNQCQVDFTPRKNATPRDCTGSGVIGSLAGATPPTPGPQPTATPTATAVPPTPIAAAGATPAPSAGAAPWFGPAAAHAFLAEGYTGQGYQEYLTLLNPQAHVVRAQVDIYRADGAQRTIAISVAPLTRQTLNMNSLAPRASTALRVEAGGQLVAERAVYKGNGYIVAGAPLPSRQWYVPEGYVGPGFADGLRLFNPYDVTATLTITAYRGDGQQVVSSRVVPGATRLNVALDDIAPAGGSALAIGSSVPVVVESIVQKAQTSGPSGAMGLVAPSRAWYFPDGGTAHGDQEYITVFNPNAQTTAVHLQMISAGGYQPAVTLHLHPYTRGVFAVHGLMRQAGLAAVLSANHPVVAQEVRYAATGGVSLVDGAPAAARRWALAEGYAGQGFRQWITYLNPGARAATLTIRVVGAHGVVYVTTRRLPARQRGYLYLNRVARAGALGALVQADQPVVVGRSLVFDAGKGLSTTVGVALP